MNLPEKWLSGVVRFRTALVLALCLALCGCQLIGDYDEVIDRGMTDFQQKVEAYMSKLESNPGVPYDGAFYDDAHSRLASMRTRAQASYKKDILVQHVDELRATLDDFQKADKSARDAGGRMNTTVIGVSRQTIETEVESILKLELALKRGR